MILCDAGPLLALLDARQGDLHVRARSALQTLRAPLLTTSPCFTEAMYLVGRLSGWPLQDLLWQMVRDASLKIHVPHDGELSRASDLMMQYQNVPRDLADATLVAAAEILRARQVFTFDRDFFIYRLAGGESLQIIPERA